MRWLDAHVHVNDRNGDGAERGDILPHLLSVLDQEEADLRFVISPDAMWTARMQRSQEQILQATEFIFDLVRRAPGRLYGACMINPRHLKESLHTMEVAFGKRGFVLLGEMLQYIMGYRMDTEPVAEIVRLAAEHNVPVQVHISTSNCKPQGQFVNGGTEQMEDLLNLAERIPQAKYILGHLIGTAVDNPPIVDGYLDQIEARFGRFPQNFWAEISHFNSPGVKSALRRIPHDRLIAGTDWATRVGPPFLPYGVLFGIKDVAENPYPPSVASLTAFLKDAGADADTIADIAFNNAAALLGID